MQRHHAQDLRQGLRIELHPATDRWMMGDRFGVITEVKNEWIWVKLDKSNKTLKFHIDNILHLDSA